jgi:DNA-binding NarL/FixJ family response regulator
MGTIKVFIADDHALVRDGYKSIFEDESEIEFIGEAADGLEAVEQIMQLLPDVAILDITMPHKTGLEVVKSIKRTCPDVKTLILSMHEGEAYVLQAISNGADGYLVKDTDSDEFINAIKTVAKGEKYFGAESSKALIKSVVNKVSIKGAKESINVSKRELEVLHFVALGSTSLEIANKVCLSKRTIENHRARIMTKLAVKNATELVSKARYLGLID